jgi:NAD(P)-dependent dehydrogenase (short-subunit alcohol dehydrogenase family)
MSMDEGDWLGLRDRICVVTGAASGIGRGIALGFAAVGAKVAALDRNPQASSGAYSTSKAGGAMLSRQIAFEWGPRGVRSNVISPGLVRTPLSEAFYQAPGVAERRDAVVPLKRVGRPDDIAGVAVFLASDRARYVTGQEILVDGGYAQTLMSHVPRPGFD